MKNQSKTKKLLVAGSIIAGSIFTFSTVSANIYEVNELGSAAELRMQLLENTKVSTNIIELTCANHNHDKADEATCGEKTKEVEEKAVEHKCGEASCGEKEATSETETKKEEVEEKSTEHKCGAGKCGSE